MMFAYYGSKRRLAPKYPQPRHDLIIEPFAGSAQYSLLHFWKDVILIEKYDKVVAVWKYLQQASREDILGLPDLREGDSVHDFDLSDVEKWLIGFQIQGGNSQPRIKVSDETFNRWRTNKQRIANDLHKIRHWEIRHADYQSVRDVTTPATWFIDPPYQYGGSEYPHSVKQIDLLWLRSFCLSRTGQTIVCENDKANWLPFEPLAFHRGKNFNTHEVVWLSGAPDVR
jgi:site-specific DNA-adenine methylase